MNTYFLFASLPMVSLDDPPMLTVREFRERCATQLSATDMRLVDALLGPLPERHPHPFVRRWIDSETELRNALVKARAGRLGTDPEPYLRGEASPGPEAERAVAEAYTQKTPLDRERALDRYRWTQAESLGGFDPFAGRGFLAYALKLKLARRWAVIDREAGEKRAAELMTREPGRDLAAPPAEEQA
jgi:hypothetical protein